MDSHPPNRESPIDRRPGPLLATRDQVRVQAQSETRIGVAEMVGHCPDTVAVVEEYGREVVPQRAHAVFANGLDARRSQRWLPDVVVQVVAVDRRRLPAT